VIVLVILRYTMLPLRVNINVVKYYLIIMPIVIFIIMRVGDLEIFNIIKIYKKCIRIMIRSIIWIKISNLKYFSYLYLLGKITRISALTGNISPKNWKYWHGRWNKKLIQTRQLNFYSWLYYIVWTPYKYYL